MNEVHRVRQLGGEKRKWHEKKGINKCDPGITQTAIKSNSENNFAHKYSNKMVIGCGLLLSF